MSAAAFLTIAAVHLLAAMSPGPSFVVAIRTAAADGFRPALAMAFGLGLGAALWAAGALSGLSLLFEAAPAALTALKLSGAGYLIWLAITMWRHAPDPAALPGDARLPRSAAAGFRLGLFTQLSNPKPAIFFGAVFVGLVPPAASLPALALVVLTVFANETLWYVVVARLFSADRARRVYVRLKAMLDRVFGAVIGAVAARMAIG